MELQRRSSGVAKGGLTTGIIGTALGGLNSLALMGAGVNAATRNNDTVVWPGTWNGGWFGNWGPGFGMAPFGAVPQTVVVNANDDGNCGNGRNCVGMCSEDHFVNRYELELQQKIAEKDSQIALRDANTYNDQKNLEMYKYVDGRFREFEQAFAAQAVNNQKTADDVARVQANLDCCCKELRDKICDERRERKCNDNLIVTYANATFYPKLIAGITPSTAAPTPQPVFNPIPQNDDDCCCGR